MSLIKQLVRSRSSRLALASSTSYSRLTMMNRRYGSSSSDDHHHQNQKILHTEDKLEISRNWPHEQFDPESIKFPSVYKGPAYHENTAHLDQVHAAYEKLASGHVEPASFGSSSWTSFLVAAVAGLAFYRVNEALYPDSHPITDFLSQFQTQVRDVGSTAKSYLDDQEALADELVILKNAQSLLQPKVARVRYDGIFERSSSFLNEFGSSVDVSNVDIKHTWQEYDRYK